LSGLETSLNFQIKCHIFLIHSAYQSTQKCIRPEEILGAYQKKFHYAISVITSPEKIQRNVAED